MEALIQLKEFQVQPGDTAYLPLAVGNEWRHTWAGAHEGYDRTEFYRVAASEGDHWYLESYGYLSREG